MNTITINHPNYDRPVEVSKQDYIDAKLKDLREFGYKTLTREEVARQLEKVLNGEDLNVIGKFMSSDIVINK